MEKAGVNRTTKTCHRKIPNPKPSQVVGAIVLRQSKNRENVPSEKNVVGAIVLRQSKNRENVPSEKNVVGAIVLRQSKNRENVPSEKNVVGAIVLRQSKNRENVPSEKNVVGAIVLRQSKNRENVPSEKNVSGSRSDCSSAKKQKKECPFGEKCYRLNPIHLKELEHPHLDALLVVMDSENITELPNDYQTEVDRATVNEQVKLLRKIKGIVEPASSSIKTNSPSINKNTKDLNTTTTRPDRIKHDSKPPTRTSNSCTQSKVNPVEEARIASMSNSKEAQEYFEKVKSKSKGKILVKHKAAAPYYFFLTSIAASKPTHSEPLSLQLFDILDPSLGDLESSLQINFMVEYGFLMAQYHIAGQRTKPMTVLYGECDSNKWHPHITAVKIKPPSPFGSHHTKMCIMSYTDGSVRVAVTTANLVEEDWENRTQGVWLSPSCPPLPLEHDTMAGESRTGFKRDLVQYLSAYQKPELTKWIGKIRRVDFSQINVFLVASTPGSHRGVDVDQWGHGKLAALLKSHVTISPKNGKTSTDWPIIAQFSSIGTLGVQPTDWLCGEIRSAMSGGRALQLQSPPAIKLIYPSIKNVESSHDGLLGGGCLPYTKKVDDKQPWLKNYLHQWKSDARYRTKAVPHIKTYTRVSPDLKHIAWFLLTSANLSKAAWGKRNNSGVGIMSYEAGVLFLPKFINGTQTFPLAQDVAEKDIPVFPLPYDLPLIPYTSTDKPFLIDILC